jgi:hypothetical protein
MSVIYLQCRDRHRQELTQAAGRRARSRKRRRRRRSQVGVICNYNYYHA